MDHAQMATCHAKASDRTTGNSTEAASRPPLSSSSGGAANEWRSGMRFGRRHSVAQAVDSDAGNDANRGAQGEIGHQLVKDWTSIAEIDTRCHGSSEKVIHRKPLLLAGFGKHPLVSPTRNARELQVGAASRIGVSH